MAGMAQVGVRTRARALALAAAEASGSSRKRKSENQEIVSYIELKSSTATNNRRRIMITPENSSPMDSGHRRCKSFASSDRASASCCSSNGSSDRRIHQFADLEEDESVGIETSVHYSCRERRETTPSSQLRPESSSSDELDLTATPPSAAAENSRRRSTAATKMPTDSELEDFFTKAEKDIQKRFTDKYNYDVVKDEPLEGRYQWVRLKP